jgi:hypothetical protein
MLYNAIYLLHPQTLTREVHEDSKDTPKLELGGLILTVMFSILSYLSRIV